MRKQWVAVLAILLMIATGSLMGSHKPSSKQVDAKYDVPHGTFTVVNYDPKQIDGTILKHQLVEKADYGAFIASGIELKEYDTFVRIANTRFKEQSVDHRIRYHLRC